MRRSKPSVSKWIAANRGVLSKIAGDTGKSVAYVWQIAHKVRSSKDDNTVLVRLRSAGYPK